MSSQNLSQSLTFSDLHVGAPLLFVHTSAVFYEHEASFSNLLYNSGSSLSILLKDRERKRQTESYTV